MSPKPGSDATGSGPVDGEEIKMDIAPHHQQHPHNKNSIVKNALTGVAIVGGIVGLYILFKHFFGRKAPKKTDDGKIKLSKREFGGQIEEQVRAVYDEALLDDGFLEFLDTYGLEEFLEE
jgi:hypothetical protein